MVVSGKSRQYVDTLQVASPMIFNVCKDIEAVKNFYTNIIGLKETAYEKNSYIDYHSKGITMMFYAETKIFKKLIPNKKLRFETISWNIKLPEEVFVRVYKKLKKEKVKSLTKYPTWCDGFWRFPVIDPAGNKVEIYMEPRDKSGFKMWFLV